MILIKNNFIKSGLILTIVNILVQIIGLIVGIFFSKYLGTQGIGTYQIMMSVFNLAATMALSGYYLAVTRLVTREFEIGNVYSAKKATVKCIVVSLITSIIVMIIVFKFGDYIAEFFVKDINTVIPIKILAFTLPLSAVSICIESYFLSARKVYTVSAFLILTQITEVMALFFAVNYIPKTFTGKISAIVLACLFAHIIGAIVKTFAFVFSDKKMEKINRKITYNEIIKISVPIGLSAIIRSFLNMLQNMFIPMGLIKYGLSNGEALSAYGIIKGMAIPVIIFPASIMMSFISLLIPEISRAYEKNDKNKISRAIMKASSLTIIFSIGLTGLFIFYGDEIGNIIYKNSLAGKYIRILAPLVTFMFLDEVVDCALKGLNEQLKSLQFNIIESLIRVVLLYILVPKIGAIGYVFVIFLGNILNFVLSYSRLSQIADVYMDFLNWILKPVVFCVLSIMLSKFIMKTINLAGICFDILGMMIMIIFYLFLIKISHCINFSLKKSVKI